MRVMSRLAFGGALSALSLTTSFVLPQSVVAQEPRASAVAGTWAGQFGPSEWIFEFRRTGRSWSGRYMDAKYQKWHELQNLQVSSNTVSFSVVSNPQLTFSLVLDNRAGTLAGTGSTPNMPPGVGIPYSGTRRSA